MQARWTELAAGTGPLSRVVRPSGRIRALRRTGRAREEALAGVLGDLQRSVSAVLNGAGLAAERALRGHLGQSGSLDGGRALIEAWPASERRATRDARASAEQFAKDSETSVGGIKQATQGYFEITGRDGDGGGWGVADTPFKQVRVVTTVDFYLR